MQTVPKSVRAIHVLATPWQPRGKHLNPPAPLLEEENASRGHVLSLRHCGPLLFLPMPPGLYVKEIRKRERERGTEGRYRGNNGTQWAGESGFFLAFAIALVKFCLFGSRTLAFSRHTQGMYRMIRRVRVEIIQNLHVETNRKYRFLLNYRCENLDRRSTRTLNFFFSFCNFTKTCCLAFNDTTRVWKEEKTSR